MLARIALQRDELTTALKQTRRALTKLSNLEAPVLTYQCQLLLGQIARRQGERAAAYAAYQQARKALEALRTRLQSEELKISFVANRMLVYEQIVELYIDPENTAISKEDAFSCMEAAKSRSMMETMLQSGHSFGGRDSTPSEVLPKICKLREELNWYYHRIELEQVRREAVSHERIERLQEQARSREAELLRTLRELPAREHETGVRDNDSGFSVAELQSTLPADAALIEYYSAGDFLLAATVARDSLEIVRVSSAPRVKELLQLLRFQFAKFRLGGVYTEQFQKPLMRATLNHLDQLYDALIAPLQIPPNIRHLIFVPHGPLHFLPFHALHRGEEYLCDRFTVSYAPSAALFGFLQQSTASNAATSLILGIPDQRAPQILNEVQAVAALLPQTELLLGKEATTEVLRTRATSCSHLHIATHGIYRQDNPMFSAIKLGDSYLSLYDLYQLRLSARLVTLSGCATRNELCRRR